MFTNFLVFSAFDSGMTAPDGGIDAQEMEAYAPDLGKMVPYWDKVDAIVAGHEAVRDARKDYLPGFLEEDDNEYAFRLSLTKFTNIYLDVVEGLSSKPFEEECRLIDGKDKSAPPEEMTKFIEDVDGSGNNLTVFAANVFFNGINSAMDWIFIDYPEVDRTKIRNMADEKAAGLRPWWSRVLARNVREVKTAVINGKRYLTYIRIFEPGNGADDEDCVRIFRKTNESVTWELWRKNSEKRRYILEKEGPISIDVIPLVPFIVGRKDGSNFTVSPPMRAAADLQIELYQEESGLKYISTLAGYPMLAANGIRPPMGQDGKPLKVRIGPMRVLWSTPDGAGRAGEWRYLEPTAQSMEFLANKISTTKQDLRELGRQPLTATSGNITVISSAVAAGKARSAVAAWALLLKDTLENAMLITAKYRALDYDPEVFIYTEFDTFVDGGADLAELGSARRNGDLSQETYWDEMKRRKVLAPEFDADEERERLLAEIPADINDTTLDLNDGNG